MTTYDRGPYRGIATVLIDGPNFQELSANARLTLLILKLSLGPSQIGIIPALVAATMERTGIDQMGEQLAAVNELEDKGWIQKDRNLVWVVKGLEFEPGLSELNPNHRTSIRRHVAGLPRGTIVTAFRAAYPQWVANGIDDPSGSHPKPIPIKEKEREQRKGTKKKKARVQPLPDQSQ